MENYSLFSRLYYTVVGKYLYLTDKSGQIQGLFSRNVKTVVEILNATMDEKCGLSTIEIAEKLCIADDPAGIQSLQNLLNEFEKLKIFEKTAEVKQYEPMASEIRMALDPELAIDPVPIYADIEVTTKCNLQCIHCYNTCAPDAEEMSVETFERIISELRAKGTLFVGISGGEPLMHSKLMSLIEICDRYGMLVTLLTNGTMLNDEFMNELCQYSVQVMKVSLYSDDTDINNLVTMQNSGERTKNHILKYKHLLPVIVQCPVIKQNRDSLPGLKAWATKEKLPVNISLSIISKTDGSCSNLDARLDEREYAKCARELGLYNGQKAYRRTDSRQLCSGGISSVAVGVTGDIYICPLLKVAMNERPGEPFEVTWNQSKKLKEIRDITRKRFEECADCQYLDTCKICIANNYNECGDYFKISDYTCRRKNE